MADTLGCLGVALRAKRISRREGLYIELRSEDRCGWGEISPLPSFSTESLEEAQDALLCWTKLWLSGEEERRSFHLRLSESAVHSQNSTERFP